MAFQIPTYHHPDFTQSKFSEAPDVKVAVADMDGVAPEYYHSTSMYPEYFKIDGKWVLAEESRMDSSVVIRENGRLDVVENRNIRKGDRVILGRTENCEEGIYLHATGFQEKGKEGDQFAFRSGRDFDRIPTLCLPDVFVIGGEGRAFLRRQGRKFLRRPVRFRNQKIDDRAGQGRDDDEDRRETQTHSGLVRSPVSLIELVIDLCHI